MTIMERTERKEKGFKPGRNMFAGMLAIPVLLALTGQSARANPRLATKVEIGQFLNSTTCIVVEDGISAFNVFVRDAVEDHWNITGYEFIDRQEFEALRRDPRYSFLMLIQGAYDEDPMGVSYDFITLVLGSETGEISDMPELVTLPLAYTDNPSPEYGYAVPAIVKFMQHHVRTLQERRFLIAIFGLKYHNFGKDFEDKTLLLNEAFMAPGVATMEEIDAVYPYDFRLVTPDEIREHVSAETDSTLFLFHMGPSQESSAGQCFEMIFDTGGRLYYYRYRDVTNEDPDGFNRDDFRRIS